MENGFHVLNVTETSLKSYVHSDMVLLITNEDMDFTNELTAIAKDSSVVLKVEVDEDYKISCNGQEISQVIKVDNNDKVDAETEITLEIEGKAKKGLAEQETQEQSENEHKQKSKNEESKCGKTVLKRQRKQKVHGTNTSTNCRPYEFVGCKPLITIDNEKLFECNQCNFSTGYKHNLKRHVRVHHHGNVNLFRCYQCDYSNGYKCNLDKHLALKHGRDVSFEADQWMPSL